MGFDAYVREQAQQQRLVIQPRMGFSTPEQMRAGLLAVADLDGSRVGTITVDSFTRCRQYDSVERALRDGDPLNGYPIASYRARVNRSVLKGLQEADLPVQVRHGSPLPREIFRASAAAGVEAIEGGPISYTLPYGSVPLAASIDAWEAACQFWADHPRVRERHIESFGGCMLGQLCPPSLLVAVTVLEGLFFRRCGLRSMSLSYSQGTSPAQDVGALLALAEIAEKVLGDVRYHVVFYTFMGVFPRSARAARRLIEVSAEIAVQGGASRLVTKTLAESRRIPTIEENLAAMRWARRASERTPRDEPRSSALEWAEVIASEALSIIGEVMSLAPSWKASVLKAFRLGVLDVPYCIHPDNRNEARTRIDPHGALQWDHRGRTPATAGRGPAGPDPASAKLLRMLTFNRRRYAEEVIAMPG